MLIRTKRVIVQPVCFHPTTVLLVDDNLNALKALELSLSRNFLITTLNDPNEVIALLNKNWAQDPFTRRCISAKLSITDTSPSIDCNVSAIQQELLNQNRFKQVAVVVTDYAMPELNGLELCKKIPAGPEHEARIRRIMLTGEAENDLAIEAFHNGYIEAFFKKNDAELKEELEEKIKTMQREYFEDNSVGIVYSLLQDPQNKTRCLIDPAFTNLMNTIVHENNICEYYLIDKQGSFLLLDANANMKWLIARNQIGTEQSIKLLEQYGATSEIIELIRNQQKLLFVPDESLLDKNNLIDWNEFLHPVTKLNGEEEYSYSLVSKLPNYTINPEKITSLDQFRENEDA